MLENNKNPDDNQPSSPPFSHTEGATPVSAPPPLQSHIRTKPPKNIQVLAYIILVYQLGLLFCFFQGWVHFTFNHMNSTGFALFCLSFDFIAAILLLKNIRSKAWVLLIISTAPLVLILTLGLIFVPQVAPQYAQQTGLLIASYLLGLIWASWKLLALWGITRYNRKHGIEDEEGNLLDASNVAAIAQPRSQQYDNLHNTPYAAAETHLDSAEKELNIDPHERYKPKQQIIKVED